MAAALAVAAAGVATPTVACIGTRLIGDVGDIEGELAFTGTAVASGSLFNIAEYTSWTFAVDTVHRGRLLGNRITVRTPSMDSMCGAGFELGHRYIVGTSPPAWEATMFTVAEVPALDNPPKLDPRMLWSVDLVMLLVAFVVIGVLVVWGMPAARRRDGRLAPREPTVSAQ